jgi:hypothetical protein
MFTNKIDVTFVTKTAAALTLCATVAVGGIAASTTGAEAGHRHHHYWGGNAAAAGVVGFAAGAIVGGALAQPRYYYAPAPRPVRVGLRPWSRKWYEYCSARYRSFDARTGTFVGYDGRRHFCR